MALFLLQPHIRDEDEVLLPSTQAVRTELPFLPGKRLPGWHNCVLATLASFCILSYSSSITIRHMSPHATQATTAGGQVDKPPRHWLMGTEAFERRMPHHDSIEALWETKWKFPVSSQCSEASVLLLERGKRHDQDICIPSRTNQDQLSEMLTIPVLQIRLPLPRRRLRGL